MPGTVYFTAEPQALLASHLEGRTLVTPQGFASLSHDRPPCSLEDLHRRSADVAFITDAQALALLTGLQDLTGAGAGVGPPLLEAIRALLALGAELDTLPVGHDERTQQLLQLAQAYQRALRTAGQRDASLPDVMGNVAPLSCLALLVHGYADLTSGAIDFLNHVANESSIIILPDLPHDPRPTALLAKLTRLGWTEGAHSPTSPPPRISAVQAPDRLHEARFVLHEALRWIEQGIVPGRILLTARNVDDYRMVLTLAARERQLTLNWLSPEAYAGAPDGSFLQLLGHVLASGWDYDRVCALLSDPALPEFSAAHWKKIRRTGAGTQGEWSVPELLPSALAFLTALPTEAGTRSWYGLLRRLPTGSGLLFELTSILDHLLPGDVHSQQAYGAALLTALQQPRPTSLALHEDHITVVPAAWLPGAQADVTITLGLSEGVWPGVPTFSSILDAHERARLSRCGVQIATAATCAWQEAELFWWAQQSSGVAFMATYPSLIGRSLRPPSGLLASATVETAPAYAPHPVNLPPSLTGTGPIDFPDAPFDVLDLEVSPTQLTRFGQCPFRWFAQHGLNLRDADEPRAVLAPHVRGRLYHLTLDHVAKGLQADPTADLEALVDGGFAQAEQTERLTRLPNWEMQRGEHRTHLLHLVRTPDFMPPGHTMHASEQDFTITWNGLSVSGTLDRLDRTGAGFEVIDYKTGSTRPKGARDDAGKLTLDVQLPIYLEAASQLTGEAVSAGRYVSLTRRERWTLAVAEPDTQALAQLASAFIETVEAGPFLIRPDDAQEACRSCDHRILCRHGAAGDPDHDE